MSGLREALEKLARDLRSDAANHGVDVRHPRMVLENRAADVDRILAAYPAEPALVATRERVAEVLHSSTHGRLACTGRRCYVWGEAWKSTDALLAAGVFSELQEVEADISTKLELHGYDDAARAIRNRNLG